MATLTHTPTKSHCVLNIADYVVRLSPNVVLEPSSNDQHWNSITFFLYSSNSLLLYNLSYIVHFLIIIKGTHSYEDDEDEMSKNEERKKDV